MMIIFSLFLAIFLAVSVISLYIQYRSLVNVEEFTNISKIMYLQYKLDQKLASEIEAKIMTEDEYQELMMEYELYGSRDDEEPPTKH
jgi:protein associated with RNAse G/E